MIVITTTLRIFNFLNLSSSEWFFFKREEEEGKKIDSTTLCTLFRESRKISDVEDDMTRGRECMGGEIWSNNV